MELGQLIYSNIENKYKDSIKDVKLRTFFPIITGKKNVEDTDINGIYPFFSCSKDIMYSNSYSFNSKSILLAGNGDFNVKYYSGKFEAYQRTYVLTPYNAKLIGLLFFGIRSNITSLTKGNRGSVISFIVKSMIEDFVLKLPENYNCINEINELNVILDSLSSNEKQLTSLLKLKKYLLSSL